MFSFGLYTLYNILRHGYRFPRRNLSRGRQLGGAKLTNNTVKYKFNDKKLHKLIKLTTFVVNNL